RRPRRRPAGSRPPGRRRRRRRRKGGSARALPRARSGWSCASSWGRPRVGAASGGEVSLLRSIEDAEVAEPALLLVRSARPFVDGAHGAQAGHRALSVVEANVAAPPGAARKPGVELGVRDGAAEALPAGAAEVRLHLLAHAREPALARRDQGFAHRRAG